MKGADRTADSQDLGNIEEGELSSNQQAIPVPLVFGEASFALQWLCEPYNQFTREAPSERPGKK